VWPSPNRWTSRRCCATDNRLIQRICHPQAGQARVVGEQGGGLLLDQVVDLGLRGEAGQVRQDRQGEADVADETGADDENLADLARRGQVAT
jgi:osmotically-inducible protein OsmY